MFFKAALIGVLAVLATYLSSVFLLSTNESSTNGCAALVASGLSTQVYYPGTANYTTREASYWSTNAPLSPTCIVQPRNTSEVSKVMSILSVTSGEFSVRSGGHSHWAGGSNIQVGVTIDLGLLNSATYNMKTGLAELQPGSTWYEVYISLQAQGVGVTGGRVADVGVGGFLTGAGNSYYSGKMGFGCDTIVNAEVVLANGTVVNANATSNADLLKALKGGSGNFGIVTHFNVNTFPYTDLWGGLLIANRTYGDDIITSMVNFGNNNEDNPEDAYIVNFIYSPASFPEVVVSSVIVDVNGVVNAPAFEEALKIPIIASDLQTRSMAEIGATYSLPAGLRNTWFSLTFRNDQSLMQYAATYNDKLVSDLLQVLPANAFTIQCLFQPVPKYFAGLAKKNGGNVLGLENYKHNAVLWLLTGAFDTTAQEAIAYPYLLAFSEALESYAISTGNDAPWRYINYVNPSQNPLASYGTANVAFMKEMSLKYDPNQVFQKKSPSGFKLSAM